MPGCYFRVSGADFAPDTFLASASLSGYSVWHAGEPLAKSGPRGSRVHHSSGFACDVSNVDGDLDGQLQDANDFLSANHNDLARLATDPNVEDRRLDFGVECRLGIDNVAVQGEWLPVDFLRWVAELRIGVALSLYPSTQADSRGQPCPPHKSDRE